MIKLNKYSIRLSIKNLYYACFIIGLSGMLGSLYLSTVLLLPPCDLCWYQRILLYPLVIIIPVGLLRDDTALPIYVLPLTILGMIISFYQHLLQIGFIPETIQCSINSPSCATSQLTVFGFMTIPLMAFITFSAITLLMHVVLIRQKSQK